jgi:signal transduction histidine kinase/CheY-like chemotaxis protein
MPRYFADEDVEFFRTLAGQAAIAIVNARAFAHLQRILDTVPEGMILLGIDKRILLANPKAIEYLKILTGESVKIGDVITHLGDKNINEILKPPQDKPYHEIAVRRPGERYFEIISSPAGGEAGTEGYVIILRDVTKEREIETKVLQQERLAAVGQLTAGIAHDFNNILSIIIGLSELIQRDESIPDRTREKLLLITQQGLRAAKLIHQVLDFSRQSEMGRRPLNLLPLLKEIIRLLRRTIPENITISFEYEPGDYNISAEPTRIQQVITNLVINSKDAMPQGGEIKIKLSHLKLDDKPPIEGMMPGNWISMSISDTGTGIPSEILPHIFEPFFTTKEPGKGTGLGLAQVYSIVKQFNGFIDVKSKEGEGTTFTVYFPEQPMPEQISIGVLSEELYYGKGEVILLVEDEPEVLALNKTILERLGYNVITAMNGRDALEIYKREGGRIDLVLTDIVMPEMSGAELFYKLRKLNPDVKVIVLTGYPFGEELRKLVEDGITSWLQKPPQLSILAQTIHKALSSKH